MNVVLLMIKSRVVCVFLLVAFVSTGHAQNWVSRDEPEFHLQLAVEHYEEGNYAVAKHLLDQYLDEKENPEALYYRCVSALKGGFKSGPRFVKRFRLKYPLHPLVAKAASELGHYYFKQQEWEKTLVAFDGLDIAALDPVEQEQTLFERGYAALQLNLVPEARSSFREAYARSGKNKTASAYYLGTLSWQEDQEGSKVLLLESQTEEAFRIPATIFLSKIYLEEEGFDQVIAENEALLRGDSSQQDRELYINIGQAHYGKKAYRPALRSFDRALAIKPAATAEIRFMIGHSAFEIGEVDRAVDQLKIAALDTGEVGQASAYQLGEIYLNQADFQFALRAFEAAAFSQADSTIRAEGRFMAAKTRIKLEQYDDAIIDLEQYLTDYPEADNKEEASELLSLALFNTSNYDRVLAHFESNPSASPRLRANYQQVALLRAKQMVSEEKISEALVYLEKSLTYREKEAVTAEAWYWKGECHFLLEQFDKAQSSYAAGGQLIPGDPVFDYGQGYVAYNQQDYGVAGDFFGRFLRKAPANHPFYLDAQLRAADCAYAGKQYNEALSAYRQLLSSSTERDLIYFQMGAIQQVNGQTTEAIRSYDQVIAMTASPYRNRAMIQAAQTYFEAGNNQAAVDRLSTYINSYPSGPLHPSGRVMRGLANFNLGEYNASRTDYLYVLDNFMSSPEAKDALLGAQELQQRGVSIDFDRYLAAYEAQNPDDGDVVTLAFNQAKNLYYDGNYPLAIDQLESLLTKYPNTSYADWAYFLLGDSNEKLNKVQDALRYYDRVIENPSSAYRSRTLVKRGRLLLANSQVDEALSNYHQLARSAANQKEQHQAREGLMEAHYLDNTYDSARYYANRILTSDWFPVNADFRSHLVTAKSYQAEGRIEPAKSAYNQIRDVPNEIGAEANYQVALMDYETERYQISLDRLFELNKDYGSYQDWIGKSFLLIADNYVALDELLQAKATLNSLIEHFEDPEVKEQARRKLEELQATENELLNRGSDR